MDPNLAKSQLMTIPELAERLRISKRSAYRVAREMVHVEIAGRLLVPELAVERFVTERMHAPTMTPGVTSTPRRSSNSRRPIQVRTKPRQPPAAQSLRPIEPRTKPRARPR